MRVRETEINSVHSVVWGNELNTLIPNKTWKDAVVSSYRLLIRKKEELHRQFVVLSNSVSRWPFRYVTKDIYNVKSLVEHDYEG